MEKPQHPSDVQVPRLTLRERLQFIPFIAGLPLALVTGVFQENEGRSWTRSFHMAAMRYLLRQQWDIRMFRACLGLTTTEAYEQWARQEKQEPFTDILPEDAKLHWLGPRQYGPQGRVLLFFYGGGFSLPPRPDYLPFLGALYKDMSAASGDISVAMLEYALMPESPFPTQLRQANAAIIYLLNKGVRPANIIVGGDSAGGNLVLQLASHILHPLPSIPPPPKLSEPLGGGVLISPWNALNVDAPSYTRNNGKDVLLIPAYEFVLSLASAGVTPEVRSYGEPLSAPPSWWEGLDTVYGRLLITAGEHECPFDHVMQSSKILSRYVRDTTTVVEPLTAHGEVVIRFGTSEGGRGYKDYESIIAFSLRAFQEGSSKHN